MIPLFKVYMAETVSQAVSDVLHSGYVGEGDKVVEFEKAISSVIGNDNVVSTNCCTSAITMSLRLAGVGVGDYVVSTPMTCLATNEPILSLEAKVVWADIDMTGNVNASTIETAILNNQDKDIKAIMCMDWGGHVCPMNEIMIISRKFNIPVIQDAAQSFGAIRDENIADYTCFSFQAIKYVTSVDGGALVIKNKEQVKRAQLMRWFGLDRTLGTNMRCTQDPVEYGYKFQMNNVNAAIGIENIKNLDKLLFIARGDARFFSLKLSCVNSSKVRVPVYNANNAYWFYHLYVDSPKTFIEHMKNKGVACSQVHGRNDTKTIFAESKCNLPGVDEFVAHQVNIPCGWWLSNEDVETIINAVKSY